MKNKRVFPIALAVAGFAVIVVGIYQGLIHVAPGYEGRILSGWGGTLNHEEILLAQLGIVGIGATVAALRWKLFSLIPMTTGGIVLFYALRAVGRTILDTRLYTETTTYGGNTIMFILGAEPFLLIAGGSLLISAGVVGWRQHANRENGTVPSAASTAV